MLLKNSPDYLQKNSYYGGECDHKNIVVRHFTCHGKTYVLRPIHTKRKRKRKFSLMFVRYSCDLCRFFFFIFFAFAWCVWALKAHSDRAKEKAKIFFRCLSHVLVVWSFFAFAWCKWALVIAQILRSCFTLSCRSSVVVLQLYRRLSSKTEMMSLTSWCSPQSSCTRQ